MCVLCVDNIIYTHLLIFKLGGLFINPISVLTFSDAITCQHTVNPLPVPDGKATEDRTLFILVLGLREC